MTSSGAWPPLDSQPSARAWSRPRGFGYGKVILLGEHAVVYGQPALAAGLSLGLTASTAPTSAASASSSSSSAASSSASGARAGVARLSVPSWELEVRAGDGSAVGAAFAAILDRLRAADEEGTAEVVDVDVRVDGQLPARAGLGSSAALSVAVARAIADVRGMPAALALAAAADAEAVFHGTASGIDLAAAASGAVGRFQRGAGWHAIPMRRPIALCVGLSGRARDTRVQVDGVRQLRERTAVVDRVIQTIGELAPLGESALALGDVDELARLFDIAHGLLAALRVSSPEIESLVHAARAAGAIGAKLTGAGGGGAVIALAPGHEKDVLARWRTMGHAGFLAEIGGAAGADGRPRA